MNRYEIRSLQARCAALGFWPGPIDGIYGKRSRAAYEAAEAAQAKRGRPFRHASGITRLHLHWTGSGYVPNARDKEPYHLLIDGEGRIIRCHPDTAHLAHTLNANGGAIGISVCAMAGGQERPFDHGPAPVTVKQLQALAGAAAALCKQYDIPVSRWSTLMHSEVQPTLGIAQRQKWDLNWLPGMRAPTDPLTAGDKLRGMISKLI